MPDRHLSEIHFCTLRRPHNRYIRNNLIYRVFFNYHIHFFRLRICKKVKLIWMELICHFNSQKGKFRMLIVLLTCLLKINVRFKDVTDILIPLQNLNIIVHNFWYDFIIWIIISINLLKRLFAILLLYRREYK